MSIYECCEFEERFVLSIDSLTRVKREGVKGRATQEAKKRRVNTLIGPN